jgi:hypothetical protein
MPNHKRALKLPMSDDGQPPPKSRRKPESRRDGAGHIDRAYAADLQQLALQTVAPESQPFIGGPRTEDDLAEHLAEQAIETATSGEDHGLDSFDIDAPEDLMSPFRVVNAIDDEEEEEEEEEE